MRAFKDKLNPKVKKNHIHFGMLFTQILRNVGVNVSTMELSVGASHLEGVTFVKLGIVDNFPKYAQKHIKKKVKKEPKEEPHSTVGQTMGTQD